MTRAEQQQETRRRLLEAASQVFARKGFHGASLEEISATAGYTQGAIYSNFGSKENLFLALIDARMAMQADDVEAVHDRADADAVAAGLLEHAEAQFAEQATRGFVDGLLVMEVILYAVRERPDLRTALAQRYRDADGYMAAIIREWYDAEGIDPAVSPDQLALAQSALIQGLSLRLLLDPDVIDPRQAARLLHQLFVDDDRNP